MKRSRGPGVALAGVLTILVCACGPSGPIVADKAGGEGAPVVLRLGTDDYAGAISARSIELYKAEVERASSGLLKIEPVYLAVGNVPDSWDQRVADALKKGDLDLALIPARAFDELGVTSLQAIQAPFLLTDDDVVDRVVTGDRVTDLMSGLPAYGVIGLALWPDGLRHPVSFGDPITSLEDFRNLTIRTPLSRLSYDLLSELGSDPVDMNGATLDAAVLDGSVGAFETTIHGAIGGTPGVVTGNITFFPKVNALAVNPAAFDRLTEEHRRLLREAAAITTATVVKTRLREEQAASELCAAGGGVVLASAADVAEIEAAAAPLYAELEKDPLTKELIDDFRAVRAATPEQAVPLVTCESQASPNGDLTTGDQSVLNGIYRYEATEEYLLKMGLGAGPAHEESGVHTVRMKDGIFSDEWTSATGRTMCEGTYSIDGRQVTHRWTSQCIGDFRVAYGLVGDDIHWSEAKALPPNNSAYDQKIIEAWTALPYTRIGDAP